MRGWKVIFCNRVAEGLCALGVEGTLIGGLEGTKTVDPWRNHSPNPCGLLDHRNRKLQMVIQIERNERINLAIIEFD